MNSFNLLRNKNNKYVKNKSIEVKENKENNTLNFYDILNSIYKIININNDDNQIIYNYNGYIYIVNKSNKEYVKV